MGTVRTHISVLTFTDELSDPGRHQCSCGFERDEDTPEGDCLATKLGLGNVPSAEDWEELLLPEIERQQKLGK